MCRAHESTMSDQGHNGRSAVFCNGGYTDMRIIKLNLLPVLVRYRLIEIASFSHHVLLYVRTLYIVWSLVRRRYTRRLTRFQTMHNVLKKSKTLQNGCGYFFNLLMFSTVYWRSGSITSNLNTAK